MPFKLESIVIFLPSQDFVHDSYIATEVSVTQFLSDLLKLLPPSQSEKVRKPPFRTRRSRTPLDVASTVPKGTVLKGTVL